MRGEGAASERLKAWAVLHRNTSFFVARRPATTTNLLLQSKPAAQQSRPAVARRVRTSSALLPCLPRPTAFAVCCRLIFTLPKRESQHARSETLTTSENTATTTPPDPPLPRSAQRSCLCSPSAHAWLLPAAHPLAHPLSPVVWCAKPAPPVARRIPQPAAQNRPHNNSVLGPRIARAASSPRRTRLCRAFSQDIEPY